jgi:hypothetical protein
MAGNGVGDEFGYLPVVTSCALGGDDSAGRRVVDTLLVAGQARLECGIVFAQVMQQAGEPGGCPDTKRAAERLGQLRYT